MGLDWTCSTSASTAGYMPSSPPSPPLHSTRRNCKSYKANQIFERGGGGGGGGRAELEDKDTPCSDGSTGNEPDRTCLDWTGLLFLRSTRFLLHVFGSSLISFRPSSCLLSRTARQAIDLYRPTIASCRSLLLRCMCAFRAFLDISWHGMVWHGMAIPPSHPPSIHSGHTAGSRAPNHNAGSNEGRVHRHLASTSQATTTKPTQKLYLVPSSGHQL